jgi:ABC-type nickel/cobalt efflux system permease component RcnA
VRRRAAIVGLLTLVALGILWHGPCLAAFTGPASVAEPGAVAGPGWLDSLTSAIRARQQSYYRELGAGVRALKTDFSGAAALALITVAFIYGVFHAAGPGHGKAVISAYMLANERALRRGVTLAALAALAQGLTAIAAVYGFIFVLGSTGRGAQLFAADMEVVSYGLITALGAWLLSRALAPLVTGRGGHRHRHGPGHPDHRCSGHAHMPAPALADRPLTLATALPIIAGIGLRPCSGAIVVLIFAHTLGLYAAGVGATLAMSAGTAITVAILASLAVGSRDLAARAIGARSRHLSAFYRLVAIAGALAVLALGAVLLHAALTAPARPFL